MIRANLNGYSADGIRRLHKGGGGGSAKYDNLEDLYKVQADSAKMLYDQANQYLPGATASYMDSVNEVLGDGYVEDQANKATADAASASAKQQDATSRNLASMGVNPTDPRFSASLRASGVDSAAKSAAMTNVARGQAKALQKATAQDAVGTFTGQSNSASSQLSGATSGMSSMFNAQAQQKAQQSAAEGEAIGSTVGAGLSLMSMMKDGGRVQCARGIKALNGGEARSIERHFLGGQTGGAQRGFLGAAPQSPQTQYSQPSQGQGFGGGVMRGAQMGKTIGNAGKSIAGKYQAASAGADMSAAQTKAASDAYNAAATAAKTPAEAAKYKDAATWLERGNSAFGASEGATAGATEGAAAGATESAGTAAATDAAGSAAATGATEAAGTTAATGAVEAAGTTAATGAAEAAAGAAVAEGAAAGAAGAAGATGAAGAGAAGAAGAGAAAGGLGAAGAALGAAMPWVGAAMVAGSLLGVFADGGEVSDFREEGGRVDGPGSHTDDLVPALLSDEEHVMNGEAAAMVGHDKLEALNKQGLALRKKGYTLGQIKAGAGIKRRVA